MRTVATGAYYRLFRWRGRQTGTDLLELETPLWLENGEFILPPLQREVNVLSKYSCSHCNTILIYNTLYKEFLNVGDKLIHYNSLDPPPPHHRIISLHIFCNVNNYVFAVLVNVWFLSSR